MTKGLLFIWKGQAHSREKLQRRDSGLLSAHLGVIYTHPRQPDEWLFCKPVAVIVNIIFLIFNKKKNWTSSVVNIIGQTGYAFLNLGFQVQSWWILFWLQLTSSWWRSFYLKQILAFKKPLSCQASFSLLLSLQSVSNLAGRLIENLLSTLPWAAFLVLFYFSIASFNYCCSWNQLLLLCKTNILNFLAALIDKAVRGKWERRLHVVAFLKKVIKKFWK